MRRRTFIWLAAGAAVATALPPIAPDSYWCDCGLVRYFRRPEGHYSATHFNGQRFNYGLHREHLWLHRLGRMELLAEIGKRYRPLTDAERAEMQRLFLRVAENDVRLVRDETGQAVPPDRYTT